MKDILFLLNPNFKDVVRDDKDILYYCPDCAFLEGVLSYYPNLREQLDIRYIDYPRPRKEIVMMVGDLHQGCPHLVLDTQNLPYASLDLFYQYGNHYHTDNTKTIVNYLSNRYGTPVAHY
jgi:hypothetical protein